MEANPVGDMSLLQQRSCSWGQRSAICHGHFDWYAYAMQSGANLRLCRTLSGKKAKCDFTPASPWDQHCSVSDGQEISLYSSFLLTHYERDGICLYEMSVWKGSESLVRNECSRGTNASWETLIFLLSTFTQFECQYQAQSERAMWQVLYMLADSGWQKVDVITWEYITADSSRSKLCSCRLIRDCNAPYK